MEETQIESWSTKAPSIPDIYNQQPDYSFYTDHMIAWAVCTWVLFVAIMLYLYLKSDRQDRKMREEGAATDLGLYTIFMSKKAMKIYPVLFATPLTIFTLNALFA